MNDWANHINSKRIFQSENRRFEEMERRAAPLMWLMIVAVVAFFLWFGYSHYTLKKDLAELENKFNVAKSGKIVGVDGHTAVMMCTVRKIIGEAI